MCQEKGFSSLCDFLDVNSDHSTWLRAVFATIIIRADKRKPSAYIENPQTIGDHIRNARLDRGLFQKDVAEIIGVSISSIEHWEANISLPLPRLRLALLIF